MTRIRETHVGKIIRRLKSVWAEQNVASAELDEIKSRLYHDASAVGFEATARSARSKTAR
jgi:hypothetical protein